MDRLVCVYIYSEVGYNTYGFQTDVRYHIPGSVEVFGM